MVFVLAWLIGRSRGLSSAGVQAAMTLRPDRRRQLVRVLVASCLSGLALGLAARLAMRFVALESGMAGGFSAGGSLEVIAFGAIVGARSRSSS
jgi:hypothetical protein